MTRGWKNGFRDNYNQTNGQSSPRTTYLNRGTVDTGCCVYIGGRTVYSGKDSPHENSVVRSLDQGDGVHGVKNVDPTIKLRRGVTVHRHE